MPYVTQAQLETEIPAPHLADAVDDDREGGADTDKLDAILQKASDIVDGYIGALYEVPYGEPAPVACREAAFCFAGELIYARRGASSDANPFTKRAEAWREKLDLIGKGELKLDATIDIPYVETPEHRQTGPGAVITDTLTIDGSTR